MLLQGVLLCQTSWPCSSATKNLIMLLYMDIIKLTYKMITLHHLFHLVNITLVIHLRCRKCRRNNEIFTFKDRFQWKQNKKSHLTYQQCYHTRYEYCEYCRDEDRLTKFQIVEHANSQRCLQHNVATFGQNNWVELHQTINTLKYNVYKACKTTRNENDSNNSVLWLVDQIWIHCFSIIFCHYKFSYITIAWLCLIGY